MKRLFLVLGLLTVGVLLFGLTVWRVGEALTRREAAAATTTAAIATPVQVLNVVPRDLIDEVRVVGALRALHEADVTADVTGRVTAILADVGAAVTRGQPLARLEAADLALQVQQAEAAVAGAEAASSGAARDLADTTTLSQAGAVAAAQLLGAKTRAAVADAQVRQAQAALGLARSRLADAVIRAPFSGVVVRRATDLGRQVAPGVPVFAVADLSELELVVQVDERIAAGLAPGDAVTVSSDVVKDIPAGTVRTVAPSLDATSHKAEVVVALAYQPGLFAHGGATATFRVGSASGVLAVPPGAIIEDKGEQIIYVLDGNVAKRTIVQTGIRETAWVQVEGIAPGAAVVVSGNTYLSDGAKVQIAGAPS